MPLEATATADDPDGDEAALTGPVSWDGVPSFGPTSLRPGPHRLRVALSDEAASLTVRVIGGVEPGLQVVDAPGGTLVTGSLSPDDVVTLRVFEGRVRLEVR